jgi:tRNA pseudouridine55 synthase
MDGILNILKPPGMTSHDVVNVVRKLTGVRRTGHTGTLDPGAAGVLPVCVGRATRVSQYVLEMDKSYRAELKLGRSTDTEDAAGATLEEKPAVTPDPQQAASVLAGFLGESRQIPPMYSAVRVGGEKLYERARRGEEVAREARIIRIYSIRLLSVAETALLFDVSCSRGTYIRTLCRQIAEKLGSVGHMSFLLRTAVGPFTLQNALTLEALAEKREQGTLAGSLLPLDTALCLLEPVTLDERDAGRMQSGISVPAGRPLPEHSTIRVYGPGGDFLAIARAESGLLRPQKVFHP